MNQPLEQSSRQSVTEAIISKRGPTFAVSASMSSSPSLAKEEARLDCINSFLPTALEIDWTNFCGVFPRKDSAAAAADDSLAKFELDD